MPLPSLRGGRFPDPEDDEQHREDRGDDRHPEHRAHVVGERDHQADREDRTDERTDGVHRLAQAKGPAAQRGGGDVGDQRVARRTAQPLADPVGKARAEHGNIPAASGKSGFNAAASP